VEPNEISSQIEGATRLTDLLAVLPDINRALAVPAAPDHLTWDLSISAGLPDKLNEWLDKLLTKLEEIIKKLPRAVSYSLTVGAPVGVSVTVTFGKDA